MSDIHDTHKKHLTPDEQRTQVKRLIKDISSVVVAFVERIDSDCVEQKDGLGLAAVFAYCILYQNELNRRGWADADLDRLRDQSEGMLDEWAQETADETPAVNVATQLPLFKN